MCRCSSTTDSSAGRFGVRFWHPAQDTHTFLVARRQGALTLRCWLRSLAHRQHFPMAEVRDPMPTVGYHAQLLARRARRAVSSRRRITAISSDRPRPRGLR